MFFVNIVLAIAIGSAAGIITGITPGIHINLVAAFLLSISGVLMRYVDPLFIITIIVAMSIVHTFLDFIPSCFLGAPDESTIMAVMPAHKLLLEGRGFEAVKLATVGSFLGLLLTLMLLPFLLVAVPFIFSAVQDYIGILLLLIMAYMILKEQGARKKFWSFFVFAISGVMGILVFSTSLKDPLFPMLSGLFGMSMLLTSLTQKVKIPEQRISDELVISKRELGKSVFAGTISGTLVSIFPGMGPAQAAILGNRLVGKVQDHMYLVLVGAIGTVSMMLSLITLYTINKARNGSIVVVQKLFGQITLSNFLLLMSIALIAGSIGVLLTMYFTRIFSRMITKVNYTVLCGFVIILVTSLVFYFTGFLGSLVLSTATAIGIIPGVVNVGRNHAMGCLLLPIILYFLL
jgi:putative membrane protein